MKIHSLFVLRRGGVPIYSRHFTEKLETSDTTLLSSFFTAILDFSKAVVKEDLHVLDIGDLRFFFQRDMDCDLIFILITTNTVSLLLIKERLKLLLKTFFTIIDKEKCSDMEFIIEDDNLGKKFDSIASLSDDYTEFEIGPIRELFELEQREGEIVAAALLSIKGEIYFSNMPNEYLHQTLKEMEIRTQASSTSLGKNNPKLIYQAGDVMIFSQVTYSKKFQNQVIINLLFDTNITSIGMADFELENVVKKVMEYL
ncbi:MAG: hypothetical protein ACTSUE_26310 [Promethearchaeota archaeon]